MDTFYAKPINPMNSIKSLPPFKLFKVEYGHIIDFGRNGVSVYRGQTMFEVYRLKIP